MNVASELVRKAGYWPTHIHWIRSVSSRISGSLKALKSEKCRQTQSPQPSHQWPPDVVWAESPGELSTYGSLGLSPECWFSRTGQGAGWWEESASNKFLNGADAAGPGTTLEEPLCSAARPPRRRLRCYVYMEDINATNTLQAVKLIELPEINPMVYICTFRTSSCLLWNCNFSANVQYFIWAKSWNAATLEATPGGRPGTNFSTLVTFPFDGRKPAHTPRRLYFQGDNDHQEAPRPITVHCPS